MWILASIVLVVIGIVLFFLSPYSPTSAKFQRLTAEKIAEEATVSEVFTEADIEGLPLPVQRYFRYCGYLGTPKMSYMRAFLKNVDFVMSESRKIKIDYQQMNLVSRPERFALISSSLWGIPFEGLDSFDKGRGRMKGTLAKVIPLFDQEGQSMDRASLVTWLAECLLVPNAALQDFVTWEEVDDTHARAVIAWQGVSAGGVFTFADNGQFLSFRTSDRIAIDMDGNETAADWSAYVYEYHCVGGILQPKIMQSVWHYPSGDCVYFNENESAATIRYQ